MAVLDTVKDMQSIANNGYLDIVAAAGEEWVIHNIYHDGTVSVEQYDGTHSIIFDTDTGAGAYSKQDMHCTETIRIRVKNLSGGTTYLGYDGIKTKDT